MEDLRFCPVPQAGTLLEVLSEVSAVLPCSPRNFHHTLARRQLNPATRGVELASAMGSLVLDAGSAVGRGVSTVLGSTLGRAGGAVLTGAASFATALRQNLVGARGESQGQASCTAVHLTPNRCARLGRWGVTQRTVQRLREEAQVSGWTLRGTLASSSLAVAVTGAVSRPPPCCSGGRGAQRGGTKAAGGQNG